MVLFLSSNVLPYEILGVLETARVAALSVARDRLRARGIEVINLEREAKVRVAGANSKNPNNP
jgi:hypothetical protein